MKNRPDLPDLLISRIAADLNIPVKACRNLLCVDCIQNNGCTGLVVTGSFGLGLNIGKEISIIWTMADNEEEIIQSLVADLIPFVKSYVEKHLEEFFDSRLQMKMWQRDN